MKPLHTLTTALLPLALLISPGCDDSKSSANDETSEEETKKEKKDAKKKSKDRGDTPPASESKFKKDQLVEVKWGGSWYTAKILEVNGDKFKVHYDGWDAKWDQEVGADKIREPEGIKYTWKKGDNVEVQWKKDWYKAEILDVNGDRFKIHYEGWDAQWDEEVNGNRIRPVQK